MFPCDGVSFASLGRFTYPPQRCRPWTSFLLPGLIQRSSEKLGESISCEGKPLKASGPQLPAILLMDLVKRTASRANLPRAESALLF